MTSSMPGADIFRAEVANIDQFGIWVIVKEVEYFLPYSDFPWFRQATLDQILQVEILHADHLYWPKLDIDLHLDSIRNPESFPLIYK
jgi:hypothetical protein